MTGESLGALIISSQNYSLAVAAAAAAAATTVAVATAPVASFPDSVNFRLYLISCLIITKIWWSMGHIMALAALSGRQNIWVRPHGRRSFQYIKNS